MGKLTKKTPRLGEASDFGITELDALSIISANLRRLKQSSKQYSTLLAIEKRTEELGHKVGKSTIDRMLKAPTPLGLAAVDALAHVYGLDAWQLLVPNLDPERPPVLRSISPREDEIYRRAGVVLKELESLHKKP